MALTLIENFRAVFYTPLPMPCTGCAAISERSVRQGGAGR